MHFYYIGRVKHGMHLQLVGNFVLKKKQIIPETMQFFANRSLIHTRHQLRRVQLSAWRIHICNSFGTAIPRMVYNRKLLFVVTLVHYNAFMYKQIYLSRLVKCSETIHMRPLR